MSQHWPEIVEGRIATKNKLGFMFTEINGASPQFIKDCENYHGTVVDIGCAYGVIVLPVLESSDANVIGFDLSPEHLEILRKATPVDKSARLKTVVGRCPEDIAFKDNSIDAIHSSFVFHFINGADTEKALTKIFRALPTSFDNKLFLEFLNLLIPARPSKGMNNSMSTTDITPNTNSTISLKKIDVVRPSPRRLIEIPDVTFI